MSDQQKMLCPYCQKESNVNIFAHVPPEQIIGMDITSKSPFFPASVLGRVIQNMEKLLVAVAEEVGQKVVVFVEDLILDRDPQGKQRLKIDFLVTQVKITS